MNRRLDIELYVKDGIFHAYIGEVGSSGYECAGSTPEECAEQVKQYVVDTFHKEEDETNRK